MGNSNELKNNLDQTTNMDEVRDEKKLTDDEVGEVAGGAKYWQKVAGFAKKAAPQVEPNLTLYD